MKARLAILVSAMALVCAPLARPAADPEALLMQINVGSIQMDAPTGWAVVRKTSEYVICLPQPTECIDPTGTHFELTSSSASLAISASQIVFMKYTDGLQSTIEGFADRYNGCVWPYASGLHNLRCPLGVPVGPSVERVGLQSIDARLGRISLYEYRNRTDSVPLWAAAFLSVGRDVHQLIFRAADEQSYRSGLVAFREMLASYRVLPEEVQ
jgi:hypothetical protein